MIYDSNVTTPNHTRVEILDLLRSVAIIFVVITHFKYNYLPGGSVGVSIFFCLSGYLITKNLLIKEVSIPNFLVRRFFRIYPTYLAVCLLHYVLLCYTKSPNYHRYVAELPNFLFIIKMPDSWLGFGVGVLWTLQVELWFYFLIPFVIKGTTSLKRRNLIIFLIFLAFLFKIIVFFDLIALPVYSISRTFYWMDNLLYGSLTALILERTHNRILTQKKITQKDITIVKLFVILISVIIFIVAAFFPSVGKPWPFESSLVSFLTGVIIFFTQKYRLFKNKMTKIISYTSLLAYTIYLSHPFLLEYYISFRSTFTGSNFEYKILALITVTLLILFLHFFIEKPGMRFGKKISYLFYKQSAN